VWQRLSVRLGEQLIAARSLVAHEEGLTGVIFNRNEAGLPKCILLPSGKPLPNCLYYFHLPYECLYSLYYLGENFGCEC